MYFKGNIVITDPCYIIKELDVRLKEAGIDVKYPDINNYNLETYKLALKEYHKLVDPYDDWQICEYGENMEKLGFSKSISKPTLCGDWSCTTFSMPYTDVKTKIEKCINSHKKDYFTDMRIIGSFCADSGMVSVLLLDEVLKYNPSFKEWIKNHSWCATVILNFDGDIQYYVDTNINAHIIGMGNINFFTMQTGF